MKALRQILKVYLHVEMYCTYMTWLTLYLKKPELPEEMLLNM